MYNPYDHYFKKAKKEGYKARSAFKLDEIQEKFHIFSPKTKAVLDIGCAPGSWLQYAVEQMKEHKVKDYKMLGFDVLSAKVNLPNVAIYQQDITEQEKVREIITKEGFKKFDVIQSDMAPNTTGIKDVDAMRSIGLIERSFWVYQEFLAPNGCFAVKVFMGPGFDEFVAGLRKIYGAKHIKIFKPKSCRKESKEIYVIKTND